MLTKTKKKWAMGLDALRQKQLARVAKFQNTPFVGEGLK